jgi:hypothetical protein
MATESCHPRALSWFTRSCIPANPARHTAFPVPFTAPDVEDPEPEPPIAGLPDELLLDILRPCLLAVSSSSARELLLHLHASASSLEVAALPLPTHCGGAAFAHALAVAVGRHVYLVDRGATLRVDPLTGAERACAPTLFPWSKFAAAAVGARIYVAGSSVRTAVVEEYDPAAEAWCIIAEAPRRRYGCAGMGAGGVFYVVGGVAVSGGGAAGTAAHACAGSVDALHVGSGTRVWARHPVLVIPQHRWTWASP